jgi:DNA-binding XRE family transcriptional regulator
MILSHFYNRPGQFSDLLYVQKVRHGGDHLPKPRSDTGKKNLISDNLIRLRREHKLSQRDLAKLMQLAGCDMDRNVITRIETQKRYVTDIELKKLCQVLDTTFEELTRDVAPEGSKT